MDTPHILQSLVVAVGLSAATGFRVFVPALVAALAARAGMLPLSPEFQWLASTGAIVTLSIATLVELGAYAIPWLDHALDVIATPTAIGAGFLLSAAVLPDLDPMLRWSLAFVVGSTAAAMVQIPTAVARGVSTWTTGGVANPVISTAEAAGSTLVSIAAVLAPFVALALLMFLAIYLLRRPRVTRVDVAAARR
ncbi:MAG TPA: DUF4126 domain-containing protein [Planctomycetota bacterium]|nr:DUF4126 domain-containing protein [Planctomycetota bacterium]